MKKFIVLCTIMFLMLTVSVANLNNDNSTSSQLINETIDLIGINDVTDINTAVQNEATNNFQKMFVIQREQSVNNINNVALINTRITDLSGTSITTAMVNVAAINGITNLNVILDEEYFGNINNFTKEENLNNLSEKANTQGNKEAWSVGLDSINQIEISSNPISSYNVYFNQVNYSGNADNISVSANYNYNSFI